MTEGPGDSSSARRPPNEEASVTKARTQGPVDLFAASVKSANQAKPMRGRRLVRCEACLLPPSLCLCALIPQLQVRTRLVVVMHRREARTSTNTGRLAVRALEGARLRLRGEEETGTLPALPGGPRLTLFPAPEARLLTPADARGLAPVLLVPDGNWTQARRLARRDRDLAQGELVTLQPAHASRYGLRRHPRQGGLCTLEAVAAALGILEGPEVEEALLQLLDAFILRARQTRRQGGPCVLDDAENSAETSDDTERLLS